MLEFEAVFSGRHGLLSVPHILKRLTFSFAEGPTEGQDPRLEAPDARGLCGLLGMVVDASLAPAAECGLDYNSRQVARCASAPRSCERTARARPGLQLPTGCAARCCERRGRRGRRVRLVEKVVAAVSAGDMDNAGKEREAVQLMAEAEKRVKASHSFLRGLFGGNTRIEEACEMYTRAANMFKMAKNWSAAGNAFCQAAKLHMQLQSKHDSATSFVDAGNAYKKADPQGKVHDRGQAPHHHRGDLRDGAGGHREGYRPLRTVS
uniref:NSF attachment protein beta n=1 Tax=Phocoena sinus TaxID=42100 RepID=A0A8C9C0U4_PHOSS